MRGWLVILIAIACCGYVLPQPPKIEDRPTYEYLRLLYNRFNHLQVVTTNPDGSQLGDYGEVVVLKSGSNYYLEVNVSSPNGKVWRGVQLTDTP